VNYLNISQIKKAVKESKIPIRTLMADIGFNAVSYYESINRDDFKASVLINLANYLKIDVRKFFNDENKNPILKEPEIPYGKPYTLEEKVHHQQEIIKLQKEKIEYLIKNSTR
jgi:transcriptional regulator with XRE-family HTH domain